MSGAMDGGAVYFTDQNLVNHIDMGHNDAGLGLNDAEQRFYHFIKTTTVRNDFIYRDQIKGNAQRGLYYLRINVRDLNAFDETLYTAFKTNPSEYIKCFENAIETLYRVEYWENTGLEPCPKF